MPTNTFIEEEYRKLMELIGEGHECVINHEEVEVYQNKVRTYILDSHKRLVDKLAEGIEKKSYSNQDGFEVIEVDTLKAFINQTLK